MDIGIIASGAKWLWDKYGKSLIDSSVDNLKGKWNKFKWVEAEANYRSRLYELYSTTRLLGNPKPINIDHIFTDVHVLDKLTAFRRYELQELNKNNVNWDALRHNEKRRPVLRLAINSKRLFILGKPGAGKTTLLKYLTLLACSGKIQKTPIFVSLKEFGDSNLDLMSFIERQFEICAFPDVKAFVSKLFDAGKAMLLFDGLDEVNQQGNERAEMIGTLTSFARRNSNLQIFITCRIAALDYSFDQFTYLEIADFDERQLNLFASRWYQHDRNKLGWFLEEITKPDNRGLRELTRTPLLLAMLCLAFDELLVFPKRRVDLYKEAIDALLKKWDASRGILRDDIYRFLSPIRKEQLLSHVAAINFEKGSYFMQQDILEEQVARYLQQLPKGDVRNLPIDSLAIIKAIESQHGLLTERAFQIYSFSHLSFQEYFTARNIIENAGSNSIPKLVRKHLFDDRWYEIFLLTASMLNRGDILIREILNATTRIITTNSSCIDLFRWIDEKSAFSIEYGAKTRVLFLLLALAQAQVHLNSQLRVMQLDYVKNKNGIDELQSLRSDLIRTWHLCRDLYDLLPSSDKVRDSLGYQAISILDHLTGSGLTESDNTIRSNTSPNIGEEMVRFARVLRVVLSTNDLERFRELSEQQIEYISEYTQATKLLVDCLDLTVMDNRSKIIDQLFLLSR
jgi:hypothetical protein